MQFLTLKDMGKEILMKAGDKKRLKAALKTTYPTVKSALSYATDTDLAKKIRHVAITQYGGVISGGKGEKTETNTL